MIEQDAKKELYSYLHSKKLEERKLEQINKFIYNISQQSKVCMIYIK